MNDEAPIVPDRHEVIHAPPKTDQGHTEGRYRPSNRTPRASLIEEHFFPGVTKGRKRKTPAKDSRLVQPDLLGPSNGRSGSSAPARVTLVQRKRGQRA